MLKRIALIQFVAITPLVAQGPQSDPQLQTTINRFTLAWETGDVQTWDQLVAQNFMVQHADGCVHVRPDEAEHIQSGQPSLSPRVDAAEDVRMMSSGTGAVRHYTAESGRVTELWEKLPSGTWVCAGHWEGWGKVPRLCGIVRV